MNQEQLVSALIAMHNSGHPDAASYIAKQLGLDYEYSCWCYGPMTRQEYEELVEAGRQYALEHAND